LVASHNLFEGLKNLIDNITVTIEIKINCLVFRVATIFICLTYT